MKRTWTIIGVSGVAVKRGNSPSAIRTDTTSRSVRSLRPSEGGHSIACGRRKAAESEAAGAASAPYAAEALIVRHITTRHLGLRLDDQKPGGSLRFNPHGSMRIRIGFLAGRGGGLG